jgi:hypothetical protein
MMIRMEPGERLARIEQKRAAFDRARTELMDEIRAALDDGTKLPEARKRELGPSAISRPAGFTREYISQIRDAAKPRRR